MRLNHFEPKSKSQRLMRLVSQEDKSEKVTFQFSLTCVNKRKVVWDERGGSRDSQTF